MHRPSLFHAHDLVSLMARPERQKPGTSPVVDAGSSGGDAPRRETPAPAGLRLQPFFRRMRQLLARRPA